MTEDIRWMFLLALLLMILKIITKKQGALFVMIFLFCIIGFLNMNQGLLQRRQMEKLCGEREKVDGVVTGRLSKISESAYGYQLILSDVSVNGIWQDKILVSVKEQPKEKLGQTVMARGTLSLISKAPNYGNFDGRMYYCSLEIFAKMTANYIKGTGKGDDIRQGIRNKKEDFKKILKQICSGEERIYSDKAEIYEAMLLGEKADMNEDIKELYSTSGIAHILAISSLHISLTGLLVYQLLRRRFRFAVSASISIVLVVAFGLLSGMSIATIRAMITFGLKLMGEVLGRKYDALTAIGLSGLLLLLDNPFAIFNAGFQMTFLAIIGIVPVWELLNQCINAKNNYLRAVLFAVNIHVMMVPVIAYNYFEIPTYSVLLNLAVVPMMTIVIVSGLAGMLVGSVSIWLGKLLILPGCVCLSLFTKMCEIVKNFPKAIIIVGRPALWTIFLYYIFLVGGLYLMSRIKRKIEEKFQEKKRNIPKRGRDLRKEKKKEKEEERQKRKIRIAVFGLMIFVQLLIYIKIPSGFYVSYLDVGQGDGIFIHSAEGINITVDGGSTSVDTVGKKRIIPYLKAMGISKVDYAIMTHADADHISGLIELMEQSDENGVAVKCLVLPQIGNKDKAYENLIYVAGRNHISVKYICKGNRWKIGEMNVECIYPERNETAEDRNDLSTVLSVSYGKFSMLLTGDISAEVEDRLEIPLEKYTVLKVAHHGSRYSSGEDFLEKVKPRIAVISVGENNLYGHPTPEVISRLEHMKCQCFRTDESGGITIYSNGEELKIKK